MGLPGPSLPWPHGGGAATAGHTRLSADCPTESAGRSGGTGFQPHAGPGRSQTQNIAALDLLFSTDPSFVLSANHSHFMCMGCFVSVLLLYDVIIVYVSLICVCMKHCVPVSEKYQIYCVGYNNCKTYKFMLLRSGAAITI